MKGKTEVTKKYIVAVKKEWCEAHQLYTAAGVCEAVGCSRSMVDRHINSGHLPVIGHSLGMVRRRLFAVGDIVAVFGVLPSLFVSAPVDAGPHRDWVLQHSFLSRNALAELLCCSISTVERIMADGDIVSYRRGQMSNSPLMFRLTDIEDYLALIKNSE